MEYFIVAIFGIVFGTITGIFIQRQIAKNEERGYYDDDEVVEEKDTSVDVDKLKMVMEKESLYNVNVLLDTIISDAIDMYNILNGVTDETYYTEEMNNEMSVYVFGMTKKKMTKPVRDAIGLFYTINSEKDLDDIIKLRIKLHLIDVISQQNKPIE